MYSSASSLPSASASWSAVAVSMAISRLRSVSAVDVAVVTRQGYSPGGTMSGVAAYRLPAFAEHVGIEIVSTAPDRVVGRIKLGPQHSNGRGVHGGAIMSLADTLGAIGTVVNLPPEQMTTTLESKTNFLAAGRGEYLEGESIPLHVGRTTMVWQTTIRDAD